MIASTVELHPCIPVGLDPSFVMTWKDETKIRAVVADTSPSSRPSVMHGCCMYRRSFVHNISSNFALKLKETVGRHFRLCRKHEMLAFVSVLIRPLILCMFTR